MSDTTEKLLPCSHCDSVAILRETENRWGDTCYVVKCSNGEDCGIETMMFRNKHEAIGAWNRRVVEKPKWTKEPKEPGIHIVKLHQYRDLEIAKVYQDGTIAINDWKRLRAPDDFSIHARWLRTDIPDILPEEGDPNDE